MYLQVKALFGCYMAGATWNCHLSTHFTIQPSFTSLLYQYHIISCVAAYVECIHIINIITCVVRCNLPPALLAVTGIFYVLLQQYGREMDTEISQHS